MSTKRALFTVLAAGVVLLALGIGSQLAGAQPPAPTQRTAESGVTIPYPGRLNDAAGQPVPDGAYDFTFALYDVETGGASVWTETQAGVPVQNGAFQALLGSAQPIPPTTLDGGDRWLDVAVRGPGEATFTALAPRQQLTAAAPTVPDSASAGLACPHDHIGEVWYGNVAWANGAFKVVNYGNGPSIWGWNGGNGNGLRGYATGTGIGVYGESQDRAGVAGRSTSGNGVEGYSSAPDVWAGVYGEAPHYGVFGRATTSGWYGVFSDGLLGATGTKSAVVRTDGGSRLLYSEESTQVWFSDYGFGTLRNGAAVIPIDPLFAQTVNLQEPYHVFLQAYGDAELYVTDRTATQFQVRLRDGDPNVEFSYRIVAKRLGYEAHRLEPAP